MMKLKMKKYVFPRLKDKRGGFLNFADYRNPAHKVGYGFIILLLLLFSFIALFPIVYLVASSLKADGEINSAVYSFWPRVWDWARFGRIWNTIDLPRYYLNTFIYVIGAVVCAVVFNSLLAYAVAILKPFGYKVIDKVIFLGYMIPATLNILPLIREISDFGLLANSESILTFLPLWLSFGANAYYYMLFKDYFQRLPKSLIEAGSMDGAGHFQIFRRIVLPLSKPIMGIVAIFSMTAAYSDFLLPYLVLQNEKYKTLMVGIYNIGSAGDLLKPEEFLMLLVFSIIPQVIVFLIFQRQIMGAGVNKGSKE
ncbi:MAG: carbohydrate ABC transporter permease [Candidatus Enteromonas sp.]|nr:carbohydrate ABC transporter permease [Candidatus Enteromonas sp.]